MFFLKVNHRGVPSWAPADLWPSEFASAPLAVQNFGTEPILIVYGEALFFVVPLAAKDGASRASRSCFFFLGGEGVCWFCFILFSIEFSQSLFTELLKGPFWHSKTLEAKRRKDFYYKKDHPKAAENHRKTRENRRTTIENQYKTMGKTVLRPWKTISKTMHGKKKHQKNHEKKTWKKHHNKDLNHPLPPQNTAKNPLPSWPLWQWCWVARRDVWQTCCEAELLWVFYGFWWFSVGFPRFSMVFLWFLMVLCFFPWFSMVFLWFLMVFCGFS